MKDWEERIHEVDVVAVVEGKPASGRVTVSYRMTPKQHRRTPKAKAPPAPRQPRRSDRTARQFALAHHVERLVEEGVLRDYAAAARLVGVTSARITQVMNLLRLAPEIQERLLLGSLHTPERQLRLALRSADWDAQGEALEGGG